MSYDQQIGESRGAVTDERFNRGSAKSITEMETSGNADKPQLNMDPEPFVEPHPGRRVPGLVPASRA